MATTDPSNEQIQQTHLGLLQQATEYSKKLVAQRQAEATKLENEYNSIDRAGPRSAYFAAQQDPKADPAKVAELKAKYDAVKEYSGDIGDRLSKANLLLEQTQEALSSNELKYQEAKALAPTGTTIASPTIGATSNDPVATVTQDRVDNQNTIPPGQQLNSDKTTVAYDEFAGVDEAIAKQQKITDMGEFAGVDEAIAKQKEENTEYTTDSLGNQYKDGVLYRAAEVIENVEPKSAVGYGDDPEQEYTTDSLGNTYKNGVLYRAAETVSKEDTALYNRLSTVTGATNSAVNSNAKAANKATAAEPDDWRVRLSLAPSADYLYKIAKPGDLLYLLNGTNGVLFPYVPQIQTAYKANYDASDLTHSNYKMHFYKGSSVDEVTITADFTAQDTSEANYMLAVIHFFKSATKMFYGKDQSPRAGTPPPLLYLSGFGAYQFDKHPLLLTSFTYSLPNDVDYIRAGSTKTWGGTNISQLSDKAVNSAASTPLDRLLSAFKGKVAPGGKASAPAFTSNLSTNDSTYVPTKIQLQLSLIPVVTRKDISDNFSVKEYATGKLSRGSKRSGGGIW